MKEIEIQRNNVTPRVFFSYCKRQCKKRGIDLEDWIEYENFVDPIQVYDDTEPNHNETCIIKPYEQHLYLKNNYNFIIEFEFWDDKTGFGYLYLKEF